MPTYPEYVYQTLAHARDIGQWYCGQSDAAALCFDVLALFPDCEEAQKFVYELFCDEWTIYDNRVAVQQHIDEWDDRPWQQRRRLALSYRFMRRWNGKYLVNAWKILSDSRLSMTVFDAQELKCSVPNFGLYAHRIPSAILASFIARTNRSARPRKPSQSRF